MRVGLLLSFPVGRDVAVTLFAASSLGRSFAFGPVHARLASIYIQYADAVLKVLLRRNHGCECSRSILVGVRVWMPVFFFLFFSMMQKGACDLQVVLRVFFVMRNTIYRCSAVERKYVGIYTSMNKKEAGGTERGVAAMPAPSPCALFAPLCKCRRFERWEEF